jgi:chromosome segregation ATPase
LQGAFMLPKELADKLSARSGELTNQDLEVLRKLAKDHELATKLALRERQCDTMERVLAERTERLDAGALSLARGEAELEDGWQKFQVERSTFRAEVERQRQRLDDDRRRMEAEMAARQRKLGERSHHLELRTAALDQARAELMQLQRETLEMRLATEEIWAQLSGTVPPAAITHSVARVRVKLAEHFKMQVDDVARQRQEVESLSAKLAGQHESMTAQKREFETWLLQQQRDLETQGARLVAREKHLEQEHGRMQQVQLQWDADRRDLEREIRQLQSELRQIETGQMASA